MLIDLLIDIYQNDENEEITEECLKELRIILQELKEEGEIIKEKYDDVSIDNILKEIDDHFEEVKINER